MFVCGKKNTLLLTWTVMNYKLTTARLDMALKEITYRAAKGAEAAQASEDLASKDGQRRLEQITTVQMRMR